MYTIRRKCKLRIESTVLLTEGSAVDQVPCDVVLFLCCCSLSCHGQTDALKAAALMQLEARFAARGISGTSRGSEPPSILDLLSKLPECVLIFKTSNPILFRCMMLQLHFRKFSGDQCTLSSGSLVFFSFTLDDTVDTPRKRR